MAGSMKSDLDAIRIEVFKKEEERKKKIKRR
jgi:hypothetical protein